MNLDSILQFVSEHSMWFAFVIGYLLLNVMKRIPEPKHPALKFVWKVIEYACFLTYDRWGGALKMLFTVSPVKAPDDESSKQQ